MARKHKSEGGLDLELGIVITPMLDMAFQLLAFFVMTFNPSALEGAMDLNLPAAGESRADTPESVDPTNSDVAMEKKVELTVRVTTPPEDSKDYGTIREIMVYHTGREDPSAETLIPGDNEKERLKNLREHLKKAI